MKGRVDANLKGGVGAAATEAASFDIGARAALDSGGSDPLGTKEAEGSCPPAGCPLARGSHCGWGNEAAVTRGDDVGVEDPAGSDDTAPNEAAFDPTRCCTGAGPEGDCAEVGEIRAGVSISIGVPVAVCAGGT